MASVCMLCMSFEFSLNMHRFVRDKQALLKFFKNRVPASKIENELRCEKYYLEDKYDYRYPSRQSAQQFKPIINSKK